MPESSATHIGNFDAESAHESREKIVSLIVAAMLVLASLGVGLGVGLKAPGDSNSIATVSTPNKPG